MPKFSIPVETRSLKQINDMNAAASSSVAAAKKTIEEVYG